MEIKELLAKIVEHKGNSELVDGLAALNLVATKVEPNEKELDEKTILEFLNRNQPTSDKIYDSMVKKFLSKKLGKEIKDEDLGIELVAKSEIGEISKKYQDVILEMEIKNVLGDKYDLLRPHISKDKIVIEEKDNKFTVAGVENELNAVKTKFPNLFVAPTVSPVEPPKDPGNGTGNKNKNETKPDIAALYQKATETRRVEDIAAWEEAKAKEEHGITE